MNRVLFLFDVDGTLTLPRLPISQEMITCLTDLNNIENYDLGFVGGSDLPIQF